MNFPKGKIALYVERIEPYNPHLKRDVMYCDEKKSEYHNPAAPKDIITPLDEKGLREFLAYNRSTYGYCEILPSRE